ncbi:MAG TPA: hypothetical protein VMH84_09045 [Xanthobacteraceae bacterium]|nr:hypothetical protein [Xanthobacteraceae bacterium]
MRPPFRTSIARLSVRPDADDPAAIVGPRPRFSRRPHTDAKVAAVRRLIEQTPLTYGEIASRTGVGRATICRWTRDGGWRRPPFAPRATDTVPRARASAQLKRRTLAARLAALAERYVRELEQAPGVDLDKLSEALELMKMAKLAAMPRHRPRKTSSARSRASGNPEPKADERVTPGSPLARGRTEDNDKPLRPIQQLCVGGVDLHRAPRAAIEDFLAHREPPPKEALPRRSRARRSQRNRAHARMLERER